MFYGKQKKKLKFTGFTGNGNEMPCNAFAIHIVLQS